MGTIDIPTSTTSNLQLPLWVWDYYPFDPIVDGWVMNLYYRFYNEAD